MEFSASQRVGAIPPIHALASRAALQRAKKLTKVMAKKQDNNQPATASESNNSAEARGATEPVVTATSALMWIENNQVLAMAGAFAVGVFVGLMIRD